MRQKAFVLNWLNPKNGRVEPIKGLFEPNNPLPSAQYVRERIHFLSFVSEQRYGQNEIAEKAYYFCNPNLFEYGAGKEALRGYPLMSD